LLASYLVPTTIQASNNNAISATVKTAFEFISNPYALELRQLRRENEEMKTFMYEQSLAYALRLEQLTQEQNESTAAYKEVKRQQARIQEKNAELTTYNLQLAQDIEKLKNDASLYQSLQKKNECLSFLSHVFIGNASGALRNHELPQGFKNLSPKILGYAASMFARFHPDPEAYARLPAYVRPSEEPSNEDIKHIIAQIKSLLQPWSFLILEHIHREVEKASEKNRLFALKLIAEHKKVPRCAVEEATVWHSPSLASQIVLRKKAREQIFLLPTILKKLNKEIGEKFEHALAMRQEALESATWQSALKNSTALLNELLLASPTGDKACTPPSSTNYPLPQDWAAQKVTLPEQAKLFYLAENLPVIFKRLHEHKTFSQANDYNRQLCYAATASAAQQIEPRTAEQEELICSYFYTHFKDTLLKWADDTHHLFCLKAMQEENETVLEDFNDKAWKAIKNFSLLTSAQEGHDLRTALHKRIELQLKKVRAFITSQKKTASTQETQTISLFTNVASQTMPIASVSQECQTTNVPREPSTADKKDILEKNDEPSASPVLKTPSASQFSTDLQPAMHQSASPEEPVLYTPTPFVQLVIQLSERFKQEQDPQNDPAGAIITKLEPAICTFSDCFDALRAESIASFEWTCFPPHMPLHYKEKKNLEDNIKRLIRTSDFTTMWTSLFDPPVIIGKKKASTCAIPPCPENSAVVYTLFKKLPMDITSPSYFEPTQFLIKKLHNSDNKNLPKVLSDEQFATHLSMLQEQLIHWFESEMVRIAEPLQAAQPSFDSTYHYEIAQRTYTSLLFGTLFDKQNREALNKHCIKSLYVVAQHFVHYVHSLGIMS
jgi:molecular chaperone GrpE (heat shock protein)